MRKHLRRWRRRFRAVKVLWWFAGMLEQLDERGLMIVCSARPGGVRVTYKDPQAPLRSGR